MSLILTLGWHGRAHQLLGCFHLTLMQHVVIGDTPGDLPSQGHLQFCLFADGLSSHTRHALAASLSMGRQWDRFIGGGGVPW